MSVRTAPAVQLELFASGLPPRTGPRDFPVCEACGTSESTGPHKTGRMDLCVRCWSPVLDPAGAAAWDRIEAARRAVETVRVTGGIL